MIPGLLVYILLSLFVAYFGRERKFGFWAYLILSFIFTPLISFLFVLASDKRAPAAEVEAEAEASA
ncbi:hypothetical protein N9023_00975 [Opitutaceae bacterium]|nr:hypothetical protein [Opitutaceae bacterium]